MSHVPDNRFMLDGEVLLETAGIDAGLEKGPQAFVTINGVKYKIDSTDLQIKTTEWINGAEAHHENVSSTLLIVELSETP